MDKLESIERIVQEIEAIQLIFEDVNETVESSDSEVITTVLIKSEDELRVFQEVLLSQDNESNHGDLTQKITVEVKLEIKSSTTSQKVKAVAHFTLSVGYPVSAPIHVYIISMDSMSQIKRDEIAIALNEKAIDTLGSEALLDLIQEFQNIALDRLQNNEAKNSDQCNDTLTCDHSTTSPINFSRRWIWVHHITNRDRCNDIVKEANSLLLCGYLKSGYPGVIVIEGKIDSCDAFVNWIKGNKSRPGGFGRNWGHHVRGQIDNCEKRKLLNCLPEIEEINENRTFHHLGEELKIFAAKCRECEIEDEFLAHVMQH